MVAESSEGVSPGLKPELEPSTCTSHLLVYFGGGEAEQQECHQTRPTSSHLLVPAAFALESSQPWNFPGGALVRNPPAIAGDTGSIPGLGRSHVPWSNKAHAHNY